MDMHGLPAGYTRLDRVEGAFAGISRRLSRANPVAEGLPVLLADAAALRATFATFFPDLRAFAAEWIATRPGLISPARPST